MVTCDRCGSIQIVRAHTTFTQRIVARLTGRRPFLCRRCGLRMTRRWSDAELKRPDIRPPSPSEALPIADVVETTRPPREDQLDLSQIDLRVPAVDIAPAHPIAPARRRTKDRSINRRRRFRAQRREIIGGVAVAAITLTLALLLTMTGSCGSNPPTS